MGGNDVDRRRGTSYNRLIVASILPRCKLINKSFYSSTVVNRERKDFKSLTMVIILSGSLTDIVHGRNSAESERKRRESVMGIQNPLTFLISSHISNSGA